MMLRLLLILPLVFAASTQAAQYQAFCWAEVPSGVQCSPIKASLSYPTQGFACRQYALALGSTHSGFFRDTDPDRLREKQEETCNYVDHQPKWGCFLEVRCETPEGVTSSLSPLGKFVFSPAGDPDAARKACVSGSQDLYLGALQAAGSACLVGARAVMTLP
jgi:hypothetical protein